MTDKDGGQRVRKALCVVPDCDTFESLKSQLRDRCYQADCAVDVSTALEAAQTTDYDIYIIENWWLTDGHGLELCRQIRRCDTTTPILFYCRNMLPIHISQALAAGAQACVSLSDGSGVLPRRVEQLVAAAEARDREALKEETRCIREHLAARMRTVEDMKAAAEKHFHESLHNALRAHALAEFVSAGGKRELFDSLYPRAFQDAAGSSAARVSD